MLTLALDQVVRKRRPTVSGGDDMRTLVHNDKINLEPM